MPSVFDLLKDIEEHPTLFLGWSSDDRGQQLRDLEVLLMGYAHAVDRHRIDDPGRGFLEAFGSFLLERYGWSRSRGPIAAIRENAGNDEEAWQLLWHLVREFRTSREGH